TKAAGTIQRALRFPEPTAIWLAHSPTATIARIWSAPNRGCETPAMKEPCAVGSRCAKAGAAAVTDMTAAMERRFNISLTPLEDDSDPVGREAAISAD